MSASGPQPGRSLRLNAFPRSVSRVHPPPTSGLHSHATAALFKMLTPACRLPPSSLLCFISPPRTYCFLIHTLFYAFPLVGGCLLFLECKFREGGGSDSSLPIPAGPSCILPRVSSHQLWFQHSGDGQFFRSQTLPLASLPRPVASLCSLPERRKPRVEASGAA